jgi:hypothetical protein
MTNKPNILWKDKAHKIIGGLCRESYLKANKLPNGQLRKKHVPYSVPQEAMELVDCLNKNDEERAKQLFMHDYKIGKLKY